MRVSRLESSLALVNESPRFMLNVALLCGNVGFNVISLFACVSWLEWSVIVWLQHVTIEKWCVLLHIYITECCILVDKSSELANERMNEWVNARMHAWMNDWMWLSEGMNERVKDGRKEYRVCNMSNGSIWCVLIRPLRQRVSWHSPSWPVAIGNHPFTFQFLKGSMCRTPRQEIYEICAQAHIKLRTSLSCSIVFIW
jgi:hypothetical protein